ncbi:hypothetical protein GALMADRAFT_238896 [Galerina marginata CBS 339.88]|uniref:NmrA-like domain-containing protein n=1 Tax=Galerina marginata (strain CBS 339.88) TaxID=685588 RepID=A0A067TT48_GALM3|nr:hypothetical protein GALMADRAFT_238896 [Galerina marginata CBS 339.88]
MTILITGGTGKTGGKLAQLLQAAQQPVLIASRSGVAPGPFKAVEFDWTDEKTFENPFKADPNIDKVYLVATVPFELVKPFIDLAVAKGVKRIVFCSATAMEKGMYSYGKIHEYIVDVGVDYVVLRPSWFIENFGTAYAPSILQTDTIWTVAGDGRVPYVSVDDIAKAAFDALVAKEGANTDYYVLGPKLYNHDEIAALLSEVIGRKITHERVTSEESIARFTALGIDKDYATMLTTFLAKLADGEEELLFTSPKAIIGKVGLRDYFEANKNIWVKK